MSIDPNRERNAEEGRLDRVVIAAAVAALFGRPASIRSIKTVPGHGVGAWARAGRVDIQRSHGMTAPLIRHAADREEAHV
jgi:hypothetical protein